MTYNENEFHTRDITLSAYLRISGFMLARVEREGAKGAFFFDRHDRMDLACQIYFAGKAQVDPQELMAQRGYLKTRVFGYLYPTDYDKNTRSRDPE